jgi:small nuclear ribonucleoprotein (snRNP)-like protein
MVSIEMLDLFMLSVAD